VKAWVVGMLLFAIACSGDSTGLGSRAASVTGVAGDSQSAPTGATLAFPLSFIALNGSGQPESGVHVTWTVSPPGAVVFDPPTIITDASGAASTIVTATNFIGAVTITAAVPGVSAGVVYHETVIDPCAYLAPYALGETVVDTLSISDCSSGAGFVYDFFGLPLAPGQQNIRISMHGRFTTLQAPSDTEDTWLELFNPNGSLVAFDDDSSLGQDGGRNSQIDIILPGQNYVIGATTFDPQVLGPYTLSSSTRAAAMSGCRQVWVMRGVTVADSITAADCADSSAPTHYYDVARIFMDSGTVLQLSEQSTTFNPALALYRVRFDANGNYVRTLMASNDDSSATNTNAFIRFGPVDTLDFYDVIIGTSQTAGTQTGAYTFSVDTAVAASPRRNAPTSSASERLRRRQSDLLRRVRGLPRGKR
jgi:hypothetical protein